MSEKFKKRFEVLDEKSFDQKEKSNKGIEVEKRRRVFNDIVKKEMDSLKDFVIQM